MIRNQPLRRRVVEWPTTHPLHTERVLLDQDLIQRLARQANSRGGTSGVRRQAGMAG